MTAPSTTRSETKTYQNGSGGTYAITYEYPPDMAEDESWDDYNGRTGGGRY